MRYSTRYRGNSHQSTQSKGNTIDRKITSINIMKIKMSAKSTNPSKIRVLCALGYEVITVITVLLSVGFIASALIGTTDSILKRTLINLTVIFSISTYYVFCWCSGGKTLAQKAWGINLVTQSGNNLSVGKAISRLVLSTLSHTTLFSLVFLLCSSTNQLPHDRLLGLKTTTDE